MVKLRGLAVLAVAVLAVVGLAQTPPGHALMRGMGLSAAPAAYTQLSFARPQSLPVTVTSPAAVPVPFEIRNTSPVRRTYLWSITLTRAGSTERLATGAVLIPAGGTAAIVRTARFSCPAGPVRLDVGLASPQESIDLLATCQPRRAPSGAASPGAASPGVGTPSAGATP
jgi:hypothetical protein